MTQATFEEQLRYLLPLVLSFGADYFKLEKYKDLEEIKKNVKIADFINKCNEGFKIAQERIVENLLEIEEEIIKLKKEINDYTKGKHKSDLEGDKKYATMLEEASELYLQLKTFKEIANVIAWTIFKQERTHIKGFLQLDMNKGYLKDKNIQSVLKVASDINQNPNSFALITDITSCLGIGDLIIVSKESIRIAEVKEGKINDKIGNVLKHKLTGEKGKKVAFKFFDEHGEKGINQMKRYLHQAVKSTDLINYLKTDKGYDHNFKKEKIAFNLSAKSEGFVEVVNKMTEKLYKSEKPEVIFPLDCCFIGIFKGSGLAKVWDFKHFVYHQLFIPWKNCMYQKKYENDEKFMRKEWSGYFNLQTYSLLDKLSIPTHPPLFFLLKEEYVVDLLVGKLSIHLYFDPYQFQKICEKAGITAAFVTESILRKEIKETGSLQVYPKFDNQFLLLRKSNGQLGFTYGFLYRLIYELQTAESLTKQIGETLEIISTKKVLES